MAKSFPPYADFGVAANDWICGPCSLSGLSDVTESANYDALTDRLDTVDPHGRDWEVVRIDSGLCGYTEHVFARPGSKAVAVLGKAREELATSPILDDALLAEYTDREKEPENA